MVLEGTWNVICCNPTLILDSSSVMSGNIPLCCVNSHVHWQTGDYLPWKSRVYSVQFSSVVSDSLGPHGLQHTRPSCPPLTPRVYPNSCPLSWWCHPTISSSVVPSPAFNLSQHQGLFKWVSSSHEVAKVLEFHYVAAGGNISFFFMAE